MYRFHFQHQSRISVQKTLSGHLCKDLNSCFFTTPKLKSRSLAAQQQCRRPTTRIFLELYKDMAVLGKRHCSCYKYFGIWYPRHLPCDVCRCYNERRPLLLRKPLPEIGLMLTLQNRISGWKFSTTFLLWKSWHTFWESKGIHLKTAIYYYLLLEYLSYMKNDTVHCHFLFYLFA